MNSMSLTHDDNKFEKRGDSININLANENVQTMDNRTFDDRDQLTFAYNPNGGVQANIQTKAHGT